MRSVVENQGVTQNFEIESAGTHGYHVGETPDSRAVAAAQARGVSMQGIQARKVTKLDFEIFDHIIAMDQGHYQILERLLPVDSKASLSLFMGYCDDIKIKDVPDPYYGSEEGFETVLDLLEIGAEGIFKRLSRTIVE